MNALLAILVAYILGAIPFGFLLVRLTTGRDVRESGSGNIGATNVLRTTGRVAGLITLLLDIAKGFAAVWLAGRLTEASPLWISAAALAVMAGHAYPVFLRFKGGKAVASCIGAFIYLAPLPVAATLAVFLLTVAVSRYVSLGSVVAAGLLPVAVWLIEHPPLPVVLSALVAGGFIAWRHRSNLERMRSGTEHTLSLGGKRR
jgi:glycerol-3-phosphate acyltransferase PlsY